MGHDDSSSEETDESDDEAEAACKVNTSDEWRNKLAAQTAEIDPSIQSFNRSLAVELAAAKKLKHWPPRPHFKVRGT